jgi:hypothetical protein
MLNRSAIFKLSDRIQFLEFEREFISVVTPVPMTNRRLVCEKARPMRAPLAGLLTV